MGRAYGIPIPTTCDGPQIAAAQSQAELRLDLLYPGGAPDVLWRVEAVSYSRCVDPDADRYESTDPRLELFALPVRKWTPAGATLDEYSGARRRWVRLGHGGKEYASRTPDEALRQFADRRRAQIRVLEGQLARARRELRLTEPWPKSSEPRIGVFEGNPTPPSPVWGEPPRAPDWFDGARPPHPSLGAALYSYLSTRCDVGSQHKLPIIDELKSTMWAEFFDPAAIDEAVRRGIADGRIFQYGPYLSDRKIEVM